MLPEDKGLLGADIVCLEVLALGPSIRFAGIADSRAKVIYHKYRKDIKPLLTSEETEKSMIQAVIREGMRTTLEAKLGECEYVSMSLPSTRMSRESPFHYALQR